MRVRFLLVILLATVLLNHQFASALQQTPTELASVRLLRSTASGAVLEMIAPKYAVTVDQTLPGSFQYLQIPGAQTSVEQGKPELPVLNAMLGVPEGAHVELRVMDETQSAVTGQYHLRPVPQPSQLHDHLVPGSMSYRPDPAAYRSASAYPEKPVQLVSDAMLRDQRIVRIAFAPFQYKAATGSLVYHKRLRVEVHWTAANTSSGAVAAPSRAVTDPFEPELQSSLLNYAAARAWRVTPRPARPTAVRGISAVGAGQPSYKITVDQDGLYRISYAELLAAGMAVDTIDPRTFHLTSRGQDVAVQVDGEADGHFDPSDSITFYGQQFRETTTKDTVILSGTVVTTDTQMSSLYSLPTTFTLDNVYWLTVGGLPGPRMATVSGAAIPGAPQPSSYRATVHAEQSLYWWTYHFTSHDTWFWEHIQTSTAVTKTYTTTLTGVAPTTSSASVRGEIVAATDNPTSGPDHRTRFMLNGAQNLLEDASWDGPTRHHFDATLPQSALQEGENDLLLNVIPQPAVPAEDMSFDWFEIDYDRLFTADADQIFFSPNSTGATNFQVNSFTNRLIAAYDISVPSAPVQILGPTINPQGGGYSLSFGSNPGSGARYVATALPAIRKPKALQQYVAPDLMGAGHGADEIFITHADFLTATQQLADYRSTQGLRTTVVNVDDLYNEFNDGIYNPIAIKRFLANAYVNWQAPAPSYVVLVGDGHWNFLGFRPDRLGTAPIYMPPNLAWVDPWQGEVDSTNLLAAIVGDDTLPDLAISRLPVNSADELNAVIAKIKAYETAPPQPWQQHVLFAADNTPDEAGDFVSLSEGLISDQIPPGYTADRVYLNTFCGAPQSPPVPCPAASTQLITDLNQTGALFVNYTGHGAISGWASEQLLTVNNVPSLSNGDRLPIMLSMTCLDGYWIYPNRTSLAEALVRTPLAGAIATFSATGLGVATGHDTLDRGFLTAVFRNGVQRLGPATLAAKLALYATGNNLDLINTYVIIGDPALRMPIMVTPDPTPSPGPLPSPSSLPSPTLVPSPTPASSPTSSPTPGSNPQSSVYLPLVAVKH